MGEENRETFEMFVGTNEVDETYVGGREMYRNKFRRQHAPVIGVKNRETNTVYAEPIEIKAPESLIEFILDTISHGETVY